MSEVNRFARYSRLKIGVISLILWALLLTCAWLFFEASQGNYGGRRNPAVVLIMLVPAIIGGGALTLIAAAHLVKSLISKDVLFSEGNKLRIRGLVDVSVPIEQISSIYIGKSDPGRIVVECTNRQRYFIRATLMEGRAHEITSSAWKFVAANSEGENV